MKDDLYKNCRFCHEYKKTCNGDATDCLCLRCPRNLGQCIAVKYCRETESVLDDLNRDDSLVKEDDILRQIELSIRNMEGK